MNLEELLREENYHLKNEITDLKNVFDINRDILRLIAHHDNPNDHEHRLLIQIITKLTAINNQALLANLHLSQEKSVLKEENLKLNQELNSLQKRFALEVATTRDSHHSTDPSSSPHQLRNCLQSDPETRTETPQIHQGHNLLKAENDTENHFTKNGFRSGVNEVKRKRKYTEVESIMLEQTLKQASKQMMSLKRYIEELENRLILFVKAYKLEHEVQEKLSPYLLKQREESALIKYALKDIKVIKKNDKWMLKVNNRIQGQNHSAPRHLQASSYSWPKYKNSSSEPPNQHPQGIAMQ